MQISKRYFSRQLLAAILALLPFARLESADIVIADFEGETYGEWTVTGTAFGRSPARGALKGQMHVDGFRGKGLVNSFAAGDSSKGSLKSPAFSLEKPYLSFLIGGGRHPKFTFIELIVDGKSVRHATGQESESLDWHSWNVRDLQGKQAHIRIVDEHTGGWGHINVDHILLTDVARKPSGSRKGNDRQSLTDQIAAYTKSSGYYREDFRPQFHFTPPVNWMNDPNGMVYYDGEYHLFYQYNPWGNSWGHMSWGHAVSEDLTHWEHLPVGLWEEDGAMMFSGSAVVDWNNTSGFGKNGKPPMIAIYTAHKPGNQSQAIAYSNDRGRTWTKYAGNPVIDIGDPDFRDPKVFWHDESKRWVMVVSLAKQKIITFWNSKDLKTWSKTGTFGPAGISEKPNWECPDLFKLPLDGSKEKGLWVLEADMGRGSVAGGSGGEYFIGHFDGKTFTETRQRGQQHWVDYGRDFYAPVSWSDVPASDGRRVWLGWMNNWETCLLPTHPWRSAMTVPRSLQLATIDGRIRMVQEPVAELKALRAKTRELESTSIEAANRMLAKVDGRRVEILLEVEVAESGDFELEVRKGRTETTRVQYSIDRKEIAVDRSQSGKVDFHKAFAGRHAGPLKPTNNRVQLRVFVDDGSIEVFGGRGETVITDCIFPSPDSKTMRLTGSGIRSIVRIYAAELRSIWHNSPLK